MEYPARRRVEPNFGSFVEIVSLDLVTGISDLILQTECPECRWVQCPKVCGDIAAVRMYHTVYMQLYLVIDWRAQSYCTIVRSPVSMVIRNPVSSRFLHLA